MSNTPHDIHEDFPGAEARIHALKTNDAHFARLLEDYQAVNREVHRAETRLDPCAELTEVELRKRRAALKDELAKMLAPV